MMWLTPAEIEGLTGKKQHAAQIRALRAMGIEHKPRVDGSPAVLSSHIEKEFDGIIADAKEKRVEPNWSALGA